MPIPRFRDGESEYEIALRCTRPGCGWAIPKDEITQNWDICRLCAAPLKTIRIDYKKTAYQEKRW